MELWLVMKNKTKTMLGNADIEDSEDHVSSKIL